MRCFVFCFVLFEGIVFSNMGFLFRLVKVNIIFLYLEKEFFLLGLFFRVCLRLDRNMDRKEMLVLLGFIGGGRIVFFVFVCVRWRVGRKN